MKVLQSFPPEICSLICQDTILERLDLNSICFISHTFRNEAQRELSYCFPCLRGDTRVKAWCLSLKRRPHLAINVRGLALLLPRPEVFRLVDIERLKQTLYMCVNLKELSVLFEVCRRRRPGLRNYKMSSSNILRLVAHRFQLTKFVNGYFTQDHHRGRSIYDFLEAQPNLDSLELHSSEKYYSGVLPLNFFQHLKSLGCRPESLRSYSLAKLRLDFGNETYEGEINVLGSVLSRNRTRDMKSLALFLKERQSHFPEVIRVIAASNIHIQHLEIHQFFPSQVEEDLPLPANSYSQNIKTLVFRPPPGLPKEADDNLNLCAYVELQTPVGRRKVAEKLMMRVFPTLTRLIFVVHEDNYEFQRTEASCSSMGRRWLSYPILSYPIQRNLKTSVITGENLIDRDAREWALVV